MRDFNSSILDLDPETEPGSESSSSTKRSLAEFGDTLYSTVSTKPVGSGGEYHQFLHPHFFSRRFLVLTAPSCQYFTELSIG